MKRLLISTLILFSLINTSFADTSSSQQTLIKKLPGALTKIEWKDQSPEAIEKLLGKSADKENREGLEYYYYSFDGLKFDTSVVFKDKKLSHVVFVPGNSKWTVKDFQEMIPASKIVSAKKEFSKNPKPDHNSAKSFAVTEKDLGLELEVTNNSKNSVEKMILWQPGKVRP